MRACELGVGVEAVVSLDLLIIIAVVKLISREVAHVIVTMEAFIVEAHHTTG